MITAYGCMAFLNLGMLIGAIIKKNLSFFTLTLICIVSSLLIDACTIGITLYLN